MRRRRNADAPSAADALDAPAADTTATAGDTAITGDNAPQTAAASPPPIEFAAAETDAPKPRRRAAPRRKAGEPDAPTIAAEAPVFGNAAGCR